MADGRPQILVFTYHKVGTILFTKIMAAVARQFGMKMRAMTGVARFVDKTADIVVFPHSANNLNLNEYDNNFRGVRLVRDPRDIWVSGYLYHRHCDEPWCINTDLSITDPISLPKIPHSQDYRPEIWKRAYLQSLGARSYQQNLLNLSRPEGLAFELRGYAGWTIESIFRWQSHPAVIDVAMERVSTDFDGAMLDIFTHLGFSGDELRQAVALAAAEDVARMTDGQIAANPHIHSRQLSKWRSILDDADLERYAARFEGVAGSLGYAE